MNTTPVLLLGAEHLFGWDGNDGRPDILSTERQAQVDDVVSRLGAFSPTKVAVERLASQQAELDAWYRSYLAGEPEYERNEIVQLGFRLAERAGATIHAVDADWTLDHNGVEDYLARHPDDQFDEPLSPAARELFAATARVRETATVAELLALLNGPPMMPLNDREYLDRWLVIGAGDNWGGVDLVASWYRRNLRIFANLQRIAVAGDRI